ncbi:hypothetical protein LOK49_LG14G00954 [Camellia lanceoleosa]|uniref:Uncharacterized protein n=1 Tax=Camellia lanceoleosa TaxID=1840588 RepID=A0ACC0FDI2_9ERIC|nr:hypothetical protein LOK49_LG14G00954 [Camellia lanceoleosa]
MGVVDTKSIESIQASLSLFGERSDHRKNRFISCDELERKKELEGLMKDMANYNVQLEAKGSVYRQALLKLNHYQKTANELSILVKSSEIEKDISMNVEKAELMETELQMEKGMTDELLRHVSELNEAVLHSKMASNEGEKEIRVVLVEKVTELALATTTVVEAEEKLEYMRKLLEVMQDLENQLMNKFVFINLLQLDLNQTNELCGSFEKRASHAISELNTEKVERLDSDTKKMEGELEKARNEIEEISGREKVAQVEIVMLKSEVHKGRSRIAAAKAVEDEYEALIEKAEKVTELVLENYYELENLKKELEFAMVKIAEFRNRAKQVVSRVEAAEKDRMRNWGEQREWRKIALAALWEKLFPKKAEVALVMSSLLKSISCSVSQKSLENGVPREVEVGDGGQGTEEINAGDAVAFARNSSPDAWRQDGGWENRWVKSDWKKDENLAGEWNFTSGKWNGDAEDKEATPKTIMRTMGVKGLALYHLKSHLQYRFSKFFLMICKFFSYGDLEHEIDDEIRTPIRNHMKFPDDGQIKKRQALELLSSKRKVLQKKRTLASIDASRKRTLGKGTERGGFVFNYHSE